MALNWRIKKWTVSKGRKLQLLGKDSSANTLQRSAKVGVPGFMNFITAAAHHFCPSLPAAFTQPGASTLANACKHQAFC